jgi:hypothetical protein
LTVFFCLSNLLLISCLLVINGIMLCQYNYFYVESILGCGKLSILTLTFSVSMIYVKHDLQPKHKSFIWTAKNNHTGANFISWAYGVKCRANPNLGEYAISWAQCPNAWCQIRVNLFKNFGRRAQISSVRCKLFYEIHPWSDR